MGQKTRMGRTGSTRPLSRREYREQAAHKQRVRPEQYQREKAAETLAAQLAHPLPTHNTVHGTHTGPKTAPVPKPPRVRPGREVISDWFVLAALARIAWVRGR